MLNAGAMHTGSLRWQKGAEPRLAGEALALMGALYREEKRIREKGLGEPRSWLAARP